MTHCEDSATQEYLRKLWTNFGDMVEWIDNNAKRHDQTRFISAEERYYTTALRRQLASMAHEIRTVERTGKIPRRRSI